MQIVFINACTFSSLGVENSQNSVLQVKVSSLNSRKKDGLFAILDGGRTADAPKVVKKILEETLVEELVSCERDLQEGYQNPDHLLYLNHTFLSAHRCVHIQVSALISLSLIAFISIGN